MSIGFNIGDYLKKFIGISPPNDFIKEKVISIVGDKVGVFLNKKDIDVNQNTVFIKTNPVVRSEIYIKKTLILDSLKQELGDKSPNNIR